MSIRLCLNVRSRLRGFCSVSGLPLVTLGAASACVLLTVTAAHAAGSGMPWEAPLERVLESVQGPVAKIVAVIIITVTGISLAFGDTSGGFRKMVQVVFGLSIAFAASSFFLSFFSFGGGALI
ncbi:type IV secretion system protein VirB2 [Bradyrhizobium yuanmingense]|uniref:Type IV secretion system protein VirB2 n=1 Tax=Bradyrhizobium yuanmingense TaxID=108015 RepID=A0A1C3VL61_9BRAD|nr:TrbC/VirB2 family protein [Bradyrhizobium yuanmingense]TWI28543.1 type IV secretion system protein VirB2 [Bradyrhizobium yuanmingense]SCB28224.1 type IV secretion system protein VirB2 [Bradyrhizobium yuanmingense]